MGLRGANGVFCFFPLAPASSPVIRSTFLFDQQWSLPAMPRDLAILECTECKRRNYTTTRNKRTMSSRLEIKKYCPNERKRTVHKETK
jgi:large subunit ribosomal protein L33